MSFIDYLFIPLFIINIGIYFLLPKRYRWIELMLISVLFFVTWGIEMFPFVIVAAFISWIVARIIEHESDLFEKNIKNSNTIEQKQKNIIYDTLKKKNKYILWLGTTMILSILVYTKSQSYLINVPIGEDIVIFFSNVYREITKFFLKIPLLKNFVEYTEVYKETSVYSFFSPLGISYYTMSLISYMADVYWRKDKAEKNFFKLLLFVLYFPKILQGPISKHRNIKKNLYSGSAFDYQKFCFGWQRMLWGYFKKLVIADRLALFVSSVFANYEKMGGVILFTAAFFAAFQLYCDFSGCMDLALGMSEIFGIELEENFKRPFFAKSAAEFWNRWHRTLGTWFTDYIYMPIVISPITIKVSGKIKKWFGKRTAKSFMAALPVAIVWMITGLWHGTGWNYILWGVYWGTLMIISNVFAPEIKKIAALLHIDVDSQWFQVFRKFRTFFLFVISRILTIPSNVETSFAIYKKFFTDARPWELFDGTIFTLGLDRANFTVAIIMLVILFYVMKKQEQGIVLREEIAKLPIVLRWIIYYIGIFSVLILGIYGPGYDASSFVYMNF